MEKLTADKALYLLLKDVIVQKEDLERMENRWVKHCIYVAIAAGRIAEKIGADVDYAIALGYVHDIGRKVSHANHPIAGYEYMVDNGYETEARICMTHSFIDCNINYTAGGVPEGVYKGQERYDIIKGYLDKADADIYDNIVQMCDLFCLEMGFTTIERRMLDITKRKGIYDNSLLHLEKVMELKGRLEEMMGCSLYLLFPEIDRDVLDKIDEEHMELVRMLKNTEQVLVKK